MLFSTSNSLAISSFKLCANRVDCLNHTKSIYSFEEKDLCLRDYRPGINEEERAAIVAILRRNGFLSNEEGWWDYRRIVLRLFLNPIEKLQKEIMWERRRIGPSNSQIGVHVRCGGVLANTPEETTLVNLPILKTIPSMIVEMAERLLPEEAYVFLSTDSSLAFNYLNHTVPYRLIQSSLYHIGHAEYDPDDSIVKRSLIDIFLMAESQFLIVTSSSGFSKVIREIGSYKRIRTIRAPYNRSYRNGSVDLDWLKRYSYVFIVSLHLGLGTNKQTA